MSACMLVAVQNAQPVSCRSASQRQLEGCGFELSPIESRARARDTSASGGARLTFLRIALQDVLAVSRSP